MTRPLRASRVHVNTSHSQYSTGMSDSDIIPVTQLIQLVKERPVLWDRQQEVYKNRKLTKRAWTEICEILIDNYDELDVHSQLVVGRNVMGKWANLRDNWLRYWRRRQALLSTGCGTTEIKKYIHHDQLLFLSKVYDPESQAVEEDVEEIQVDVDVLSDLDEELAPDQNYDETSKSTWNMEDSAELISQTVDDKQHLYFFHSILPMIQDLDERQSLQLHTEILDCINRLKFGFTEQKYQEGSIENIDKQKRDDDRQKHSNSIAQNTTQHLAITPNKREHSFTTESLSNLEVKALIEKNPSTTSILHNNESLERCSEFTNLNNVVKKLKKISDTFVYSSFGDSHEQFGKYVASLMRKVQLNKIQFIKRKIVRELVKVRLSHKRNYRRNNLQNRVIDLETKNSRELPKEQLTVHPQELPSATSQMTDLILPSSPSNKNQSCNFGEKHTNTLTGSCTNGTAEHDRPFSLTISKSMTQRKRCHSRGLVLEEINPAENKNTSNCFKSEDNTRRRKRKKCSCAGES